MEDPYSAENIDRLGVLMFQTSENSQLLRRVLWINAELTIVWSLKHQNTQPIYIFNRVSVLHLDRLKEGTWLHSFECRYPNCSYSNVLKHAFYTCSEYFSIWKVREKIAFFHERLGLCSKYVNPWPEKLRISTKKRREDVGCYWVSLDFLINILG